MLGLNGLPSKRNNWVAEQANSSFRGLRAAEIRSWHSGHPEFETMWVVVDDTITPSHFQQPLRVRCLTMWSKIGCFPSDTLTLVPGPRFSAWPGMNLYLLKTPFSPPDWFCYILQEGHTPSACADDKSIGSRCKDQDTCKLRLNRQVSAVVRFPVHQGPPWRPASSSGALHGCLIYKADGADAAA
jgi:hypothetical protein